MICAHCRAIIPEDSAYCGACGKPVMRMEDELRWVLPVNTSVLAIFAGYAALFAVLVFPAPIALILGIVAAIDLKRRPGRRGMGRAVFAIIMGVLGSAVLVLVAISMLAARR